MQPVAQPVAGTRVVGSALALREEEAAVQREMAVAEGSAGALSGAMAVAVAIGGGHQMRSADRSHCRAADILNSRTLRLQGPKLGREHQVAS